jgi:hypothetical protein
VPYRGSKSAIAFFNQRRPARCWSRQPKLVAHGLGGLFALTMLWTIGCGGGAWPPTGAAGPSPVPAVAAGAGVSSIGSAERALATTDDAKAARYRKIARDERSQEAASSSSVNALAAQSTVTASKTSAATATAAATPRAAVATITAKNDAVTAKRQSVAVWADRMAAKAQAMADFHRARAAKAVGQ